MKRLPDCSKIFLSYTLRDSRLNLNILEKIKKIVEETKKSSVYIDILDNDPNDARYQERVFEKLSEADVFLLIESALITESKWAKKEIDFAKKHEIQMIFVNIDEVLSWID